MVESSTASATAVLRARYPRTAASLDRYGGGTARRLERTGTFARFTRVSVVQIGWALRRYRRETLRLVAEIGMGTGAMAVVGGTVAIIGFVTLSGGSLIAIQGFASLGNIGVEAFTGFFAALANTRVAAPIVSGVALAATVGAGATAQLGAMRISEEIDALEVMGIKSISFLVSSDSRRAGGDHAAVRARSRHGFHLWSGGHNRVLRPVQRHL